MRLVVFLYAIIALRLRKCINHDQNKIISYSKLLIITSIDGIAQEYNVFTPRADNFFG